MSNRQNQEREARLQPKRMETAIAAIEQLGLPITFKDETTLRFTYNGSTVSYYPYSGWHSGKSIRDGRGLDNLLKQLKQ